MLHSLLKVKSQFWPNNERWLQVCAEEFSLESDLCMRLIETETFDQILEEELKEDLTEELEEELNEELNEKLKEKPEEELNEDLNEDLDAVVNEEPEESGARESGGWRNILGLIFRFVLYIYI
jgi:hypothetical protein